ncbi:hypothetical protein BpHYR1_016037 [Brachionus plicatilis]|uniref:Uncharacterized protein n=1 Tax=Brachionus plicatilis TaxID=10195 RepID=A0A3M7PPW6_BRAPC|nr:hypothetical protein BpHYR1_016037 [Brachionus plicatilis]
MKFDNAPTILKDQLQTNYSTKLKWNLRNSDKLVHNGAGSKFVLISLEKDKGISLLISLEYTIDHSTTNIFLLVTILNQNRERKEER